MVEAEPFCGRRLTHPNLGGELGRIIGELDAIVQASPTTSEFDKSQASIAIYTMVSRVQHLWKTKDLPLEMCRAQIEKKGKKP